MYRFLVQMDDSRRKVFWELLQCQDVLFLMTRDIRESAVLEKEVLSCWNCKHLLQRPSTPPWHTRTASKYRAFIFLLNIKFGISRN